MKRTLIRALALAAIAFMARATYAGNSSQSDVIAASATVNNGATLNSITVLWSHKSFECSPAGGGAFVPTSNSPGPGQHYLAGTLCDLSGDAKATVTQTNAVSPVHPQPFTVTATDLGASGAANFVGLLNPVAGDGHVLGINLSLSIDGASPSAAAFGTPFTETTSLSSTIDISGSLAQEIGYASAVDATHYANGSYQGSFDVIVSL